MSSDFHAHCFACGERSPSGLRLTFELLDDGTVRGTFRARDDYQGYDHVLHGGIISTILDASMVHLFYLRDGAELRTARLNVRFIRPVSATATVTVCAAADGTARHFYKAAAQLKADGLVFAEAEGWFRRPPGGPSSREGGDSGKQASTTTGVRE